jgi:catechol 2,3-dioxygenase-like lactoylglutathione lyase family enzyme
MPRSKKSTAPATPTGTKVLFIAGFGPIVRDVEASRRLYAQTLGIPFEEAPGGYRHTDKLDGAKHYALWPLAQAAESCFGTEEWPKEIPAPQAWLELDVEDIHQATEQLKSDGYRLLVAAREEPWGQTVTRFLSPEGLLLGVTHTPWMRSPDRAGPDA